MILSLSYTIIFYRFRKVFSNKFRKTIDKDKIKRYHVVESLSLTLNLNRTSA